MTSWFVFLVVQCGAAGSSLAAAGRIALGARRIPTAAVLASAIMFHAAHATLVALIAGRVLFRLDAATVIITSLALSAVTAAACWRGFSVVRDILRHAASGWGEIDGRITRTMLVILGAYGALLMYYVIALPPLQWDTLVYRLPAAVHWYHEGRITDVMMAHDERLNAMTLGMSLLATWYFIIPKTMVLAEMGQFLFVPALGFVVWGFMRLFDADRRTTFIFTALVVLMPTVRFQAVTLYDHLALAASFLAALLFMALVLRGYGQRWLIPAGVALGLCLGFKNSGPVHLAVAAAVFAVLAWRSRLKLRPLMMPGFSGLALCVVLGGYWYLRNWLIAGNPLYGSYRTKTFDVSGGVMDWTKNFVVNLVEFLPRIADADSIYRAVVTNSSGFGPQFFVFGLVGLAAMLPAVRRRMGITLSFTPDRLMLLGPVGLMTAAYWMLYVSPWTYRLHIPLGVTFLLTGGLVMSRYGRQRAVDAIAAACMVFVLAMTFYPGTARYPERWGDEPRLAATMVYKNPAAKYVVKNLPVDEPVVWVAWRNVPLGMSIDMAWRRRIVPVPMDRVTIRDRVLIMDDELRSIMQEYDAKWLVYEPAFHEPGRVSGAGVARASGVYHLGEDE